MESHFWTAGSGLFRSALVLAGSPFLSRCCSGTVIKMFQGLLFFFFICFRCLWTTKPLSSQVSDRPQSCQYMSRYISYIYIHILASGQTSFPSGLLAGSGHLPSLTKYPQMISYCTSPRRTGVFFWFSMPLGLSWIFSMRGSPPSLLLIPHSSI